jgi:hypothetical protein
MIGGDLSIDRLLVCFNLAIDRVVIGFNLALDTLSGVEDEKERPYR